MARRFRQFLSGVVAFACLVAFFFLLLRWRTNTPEQHLNFDGTTQATPPEQSHD